jgi:hypothetical protein
LANAAGDGATNPVPSFAAAPSQQPTFTLRATAIFHEGNTPAVWIITGNDSTLQLRAVKVSSYTDHSTVVAAGLNDGDVVVLAGVHTVYAGQHVKPVHPLFDGEGNIDGPASVTQADASATTSVPVTPASASATTIPTPATPADASANPPVAARANAHPANIPQVAATQSNAGAQ